MKPVLLVVFLLAACGSNDAPEPAHVPVPGLTTDVLDVSSRNPAPQTAVTATHTELLAGRATERHPSDGGGRAWIEEGPTRITAGTQAAWVLRYEAGPLGVAEGGMVALQTSPFWEWSTPHDMSAQMLGYTVVEVPARKAGDALAFEVFAPGNGMFIATIRGRDLAPGEVLDFIYGARGALARADRYAEKEERFWFAVDGDGDGVRGLVADSPMITIEPGVPAILKLFLPPTARPGSTVDLTAVVLDRYGNAGYPFEGELLLARDGQWPGVLPERVVFAPEDRGRKQITFTLPDDALPGVMRIGGGAVGTTSRDRKQGGMTTLSNPMWIDPAAPRVLVGDLHGHSNLSDGTGRPEDFYAYARDYAALDVAVLTDHDHWGMQFLDEHPDLWARIGRAAKQANDPGTFTALLGFEWTSWLHGHRHVLYFQDAGEMISSLDAVTPDDLWDRLRAAAGRGIRALTFAHHSAGAPVPTNWSFPPDPEFEPITEVASVHGTSEAWDAPLKLRGAWKGNFVRDVLDAGVELGFVGSGDGHDGHPGLAHLVQGTGGIAMLFAEHNDRESVRASLQARACYATTGPRIVLVAELGTGSERALMGADVNAAELSAESTVTIKLFGTAPLSALEVVRSGAIVKTLNGARMGQVQGAPPNYAAELGLAELGLADLKPGEYVYLRATQAGLGLAWSSPWFIE